jgi:serine protease
MVRVSGSRVFGPGVRLLVCTAALAAGAVSVNQAQLAQALPSVFADVAVPAIDRGLRDADPPRPPRNEGPVFAAAASEPYVAGSIIVKFRPGTSPDAQRMLLAQVDGSAGRPVPYADFEIVAIDPQDDPEAAARALDAQPDVEYAQARYRIHPRFTPNDPLFSRQWNYPLLDMERAWDINPGASPSVTVAVLDSGVAYRSALVQYRSRAFTLDGIPYPSLGTVVVPFAAAPELAGADRFVSPRDFIWDTNLPLDLDGHGTHVAGTIGQATNNGAGVAGMAFNVRIMPVKVIAGLWDLIFDSPFQGTDDVVARGIRYAADYGADVINMSIGRTGPAAPVIREAINYAVNRGVFVVVAAGNDFETGNRVERLAEFAPDIEGMVAVGGIGRNRERAFYSNTGSYVELMAPGGNTRVGGTEGGILQQTFDFDLVETYFRDPSRFTAPRFDSFAYDYLQGTSMAAPHVSGFAALLIQQGITKPAAP